MHTTLYTRILHTTLYTRILHTTLYTRILYVSQATKACWDFEGIYCCSRHIPGVRFAGITRTHIVCLCLCLCSLLLATTSARHDPPGPGRRLCCTCKYVDVHVRAQA